MNRPSEFFVGSPDSSGACVPALGSPDVTPSLRLALNWSPMSLSELPSFRSSLIWDLSGFRSTSLSSICLRMSFESSPDGSLSSACLETKLIELRLRLRLWRGYDSSMLIWIQLDGFIFAYSFPWTDWFPSMTRFLFYDESRIADQFISFFTLYSVRFSVSSPCGKCLHLSLLAST